MVKISNQIYSIQKKRVFKKSFLIFLLAILSLFSNPSFSVGQWFFQDKEIVDKVYIEEENAPSNEVPSFTDTEDIAVLPDEIVPDKKLSIGVILPLSGDYASFGESALKGILLAGGVFGPQLNLKDEGLSVDIIVRDSQNDPLITAKLVDELEREDVIGIIGPLLSKTSVAGALEAQDLKIPMISLSQKKALPETGDYIFRNSMTPYKQVETLAQYAIMELGLERFGILYPENPYGKRLTYAFIGKIRELGGEIVRLESYRDNKSDFGPEIKNLFQITEVEDPKNKERMIFEPVLDFDALFIPDYFYRVGLIAPQLAFYNIKDIQLLGSNGWNSPQLIEIGGRFVEKAIFVDGFFLDSSDPVIEYFIEDFEATFHIIPGILEAQAFDVTNMIISLLKEEGVIDRDSLKEFLYSIEDFPGVTGWITVDRQGDIQKELFILNVEEGKIVQAEELEILLDEGGEEEVGETEIMTID
ncbi:MAG: penicillin-binding protein activator [Thermodesulfobacteriota bacterium]